METVSTAVTSIRRRNDIEKYTWRTHQYFESTMKFPRRIDVIISTWIRLSKSNKLRRTFHVKFRHRIDGESTKMCPLGYAWKILLHLLYHAKSFSVL